MAWVDPSNGFDPVPPVMTYPPHGLDNILVAQLNDETLPYKTLQQAIDGKRPEASPGPLWRA
jgi:hypothetical protein